MKDTTTKDAIKPKPLQAWQVSEISKELQAFARKTFRWYHAFSTMRARGAKFEHRGEGCRPIACLNPSVLTKSQKRLLNDLEYNDFLASYSYSELA